MAYLDDLPVFLRNVREYRALAAAFDPVMEELKKEFAAFSEKLQPSSAEGEILARWEKMTSLPSAGTLEQRRFRLLSRLGSLRPYTEEQLRRQLAVAFGREDCFTVDIDGEAFTAAVEVDPDGEHVLAAMTDELRRMIPANMILYTRVGAGEEMSLCAGAVLQVTTLHDIR